MTITTMKKLLATAATLALLSACSPAQNDENDPMEDINRGVFEFNQFVDQYGIGPVAEGYRYVTPYELRSRIGNVADNLQEPLNMIHAFLQGDFQQGVTTFWRFAINTTIGIGGMNDVASTAGLKPRNEDLGQTLAVWGVGDGPYVVLPILGPSNLRDTTGTVGDWFIDPVNYAIDDTSTEIWLAAGQGLVKRERLIEVFDDVNETSLDPYATFRSMYRQHRAAQISNQGEGKLSGNDTGNE
jgi:phospholipid-binding lipoprotein MlaA